MSKNIIFTIFTLCSFLAYPVFSMEEGKTPKQLLKEIFTCSNLGAIKNVHIITSKNKLLSTADKSRKENIKYLKKEIAELKKSLHEEYQNKLSNDFDNIVSLNDSEAWKEMFGDGFLNKTKDKQDNIIVNASSLFIIARYFKNKQVMLALGNLLLNHKTHGFTSNSQTASTNRNALNYALSLFQQEPIKKALYNSVLGLSGQAVENIMSKYDYKVFLPGEVICQKGDTSEYLYTIVKGEVEVCIDDIKVATFGEGDVVGELGFVGKEPRTATLIAKETTEVCYISYDNLETYFQSNLGAFKNLLSTMVKRYASTKVVKDYIGDLDLSIYGIRWNEYFNNDNFISLNEEEINEEGFYHIISGNITAVKDGHVISKKEAGSYFGTGMLFGDKKTSSTKFIANSPDVKLSFIPKKKALELAMSNYELLKGLFSEVVFLTKRANSLVAPNDVKTILINKGLFTKASVDSVVGHGHRETLQDDEEFCQKGNLADSLIIILDGELSVISDGKEVASLGCGNILGESGIIEDGAKRTATLKSRGKTALYIIPYESIMDEGLLGFFTMMVERFLKTKIGRDVNKGERTLPKNNAQTYKELFAVSKKYNKGKQIFKANNKNARLALVDSGEVIINKNGHTLGKKKEGDVFIVDKKLKYFAESKVDILYISKKDAKKKLEENQDLLKIFLKDIKALTERANSLVLPGFLQLLKPENKSLAEAYETFSYKTGDAIFNQGEISEGVYFITKGKVDIEIGDTVVAQAKTGTLIGEMGLAREGNRSATVRAAARTEAIFISYEAIKKKILKKPDLLARLLKDMAAKAQRTIIKEENLSKLISLSKSSDQDEKDNFKNYLYNNFNIIEASADDLNEDREHIWLLIDGSISLNKNDKCFGEMGGSYFFGLERLSPSDNSQHIITALFDGKINAIKLTREEFFNLCQKNKDFGWFTFQELSDLINHLNRCI